MLQEDNIDNWVLEATGEAACLYTTKKWFWNINQKEKEVQVDLWNDGRIIFCNINNSVACIPIARERLAKHIPAATNTQATFG
jgi:hypothetical protein